jgi:tripartite-type tricarboxylate transporter receptor subunit TctC
MNGVFGMRPDVPAGQQSNTAPNGIVRRLTTALTLAALLLPFAALAQSQPIRIIFPFAPGGGGDGLARLIADALGKELGEQVIVENRVGADGRIGVRAVTSAKADGRTLLFCPIAPITIHPWIHADLPYDPMKDLAPVSQVAKFEYALATGPLTATDNLKDAVVWFQAHPKQASFGSPGTGGLPQFVGILFSDLARLDLRHVPYRGSMPALSDVAAGHLALAVTPTSDVAALHQAGNVRILATSGKARSPLLPDVPTFTEQGFDLTGDGWYSLYAPTGTPDALVQRYSEIVAQAVRTPDAAKSFGAMGLQLVGSTPQELAAIQQADYERWKGAVKRFVQE